MATRSWLHLTWSEKTWGERAQTSVCFVLAGVITFGMFIGGLLVLGMMSDGLVRHKTEHDQCLKRATTGYEIKQCR